MSDVFERLKSSRLWALLLFVGLILVNAMMEIGLSEEEIRSAMWATLGYIGFDTMRGTVVGGLIEQGVLAISSMAKDKLPAIETIEDDGTSER